MPSRLNISVHIFLQHLNGILPFCLLKWTAVLGVVLACYSMYIWWMPSGHVQVQPNAFLFEEAMAWSHHSDSLHDICLSHLQLNTRVSCSVDCCSSNKQPHHKKAFKHSRSATTSSAEFIGVSFCGMLALRLRETNTTRAWSSICTLLLIFIH